MGEVVQGNFGGKSAVAESQTVEGARHLPQEETDLVLTDLKYYFANPDRVHDAISQSDTITNYVFSLQGFRKKNESLDLRRDSLSMVPVETLCSHLLDSNEQMWKTQPHFYGAVIVELNDRCKVINIMKERLKEIIDNEPHEPPD